VRLSEITHPKIMGAISKKVAKVAKVAEKEPNKTLCKIMHNTSVSRKFLSRGSFIPV